MTRLTRVLRALMMVLVLPALLVPSGWSARVCLCELLSSGPAKSCCESAEASPAAEAVASCCVGESDGAVRALHGPANDGDDAPLEACGDSNCDRCCRVVNAGQIELMASYEAPVSAPAPTLFASATVEPVAAPAPRHRTLSEARRALAPPRASSALPLRI